MEARLAAVRKAIGSTVDDKRSLLFHVVKSDDMNSVLYFYKDNAIVPKWIILEGSSKPMPYLKDLDIAEKLIFGASIETLENDTLIVSINGDMEKKMRVELVLDSAGNPALITTIKNQPARVSWAYAELSKGAIPGIDSLTVGGQNFSGQLVQDVIL